MTWKKRIISIVLCLCALLCAASVRAEAADHSHPICGASHKDIGDHTSDNCSTPTWTAWNGGDITYNNEGKAYIYLSDDVTLTQTDSWGDALHLEVKSGNTLYLCLNGHSLKSKAYYAIYVSGTLVLCDCNGSEQNNGTISHAANADGSIFGADGIYVVDNAIFTMYGGTISNNDGRGVLVSGGTFTMYGGEISKNKRTALDTETITYSAEGGGGVWVKDYKSWSSGQTTLGNFAMYGGKISDNEVQSKIYGGGGVCMDSDGSFYMENGTITGNKCNNSGGGLDIRCETITIKGNSTISGNTCGGDGGGIFAISSAESSITNCTISNNAATGKSSKGGGLAFQNSTFTLEKCTITGNKAQDRGGGIFVLDNTANLTLSSGLKFSGNKDNCTVDTATGSLTGGTANDVFLHTGAYLRLDSTFGKTPNTDPIIVTTYFTPNGSGYQKIAEDNRIPPKPTDFTYGNDSAISIIAKTNNGTVELLACKHNYSIEKDETNHWQKCSICKDKKDVTAHQYNQEKAETGCLKTAATCTAKAVYYKSCVCGARGTATFESGNSLGHDFSVRQYGENDHWMKCSRCDATDTKEAHTGGTASCTAKAKCSVCGQEYGGLKAHDFANGPYQYDGEQHWYKCANCTATTEPVAHTDFTAWKSDRSGHWHECSTCGYKTAVNAHTPDRDKATETTPQLCTECGYVIAPATHPVHTWVFVAETPATCNAAGEREHYKCACGRTSFKNGDAYNINEDASVLTIEKNSANHTGAPDSKWHSDSANHWQEYTCCQARANEAAHSGGAATCTAQAVCQVCGKAYGPLAAHDWQPATCTAPKTCSVCHTTEGTALAHAWQPATCTAPKTCSVCHTTEGTALGHAWQPATCTAPKTCTACHVTEGAALGHDWGAWKVTTPATKDAPGVETRTCAHNSAHTETRSIPKLSTTVYTVSEDTKIAQIEAKVDGLDKILELNENKALVNDGKSVGVSLTVKNTASSGVSEKIKEKLAGSNLVGLRLELTVEKTVTANGVVESKQTIPDAGVLLKTTITLPAELQGKSGYVVYRLHDGNVHVLTETANENGEFISVSADKTQITICARLYSEYVIAYQTGGSSGGGYHPVNPTPVKATSANTGDAGVLLYGVTAALSLTGTAWLGAKSRKH